MHETSDFFYPVMTFSYTKYFVHSYTADVVFTLSNGIHVSKNVILINIQHAYGGEFS